MNELERHEGVNRAKSETTDRSAGRANRDIGAATDRAKASLRDAKDSAETAYDDITSQARGAYRQARSKVSRLGHTVNSPEAARRAVVDFVDTNPALVAVVGLAAGLIAGALLPGTRREDEMFGRYADDAKDQGFRYARDLVEQGRHYIEESFDTAGDEVRKAG